MPSNQTVLAGLLGLVLAGAVAMPSVAIGQGLEVQLTTSRGCRESGDDPVYSVGETIAVSFRIGSGVVSAAAATLFDRLPDGRVAAISFGTVATNQTRSFQARIGPPTGIEQLVLRAAAPGVRTASRACSFRVVAAPAAGTPTVTRTPTPVPPTRTATATAPTRTATATAGRVIFDADLRTSRGCIETGDNPVFAVGETTIVSFRIRSNSSTIATAVMADFLANGFVKLFSFGLVPTNATLQFRARIGPPVGTERLVLNARGVRGLSDTVTCSFTVVGGAVPTRSATRTTVATATPQPTFTPTVTPPAANLCVGSCSRAGMVSVDDLVKVIDIAAGRRLLGECPSADADGNRQVTLDEVLQAVNDAIHGCTA